MILGGELGVEPQSLSFAPDTNGKPALIALRRRAPAPHISLAHDGALAHWRWRRTARWEWTCRQLAEGLDPVDMSERYFLPFEARYVAGGHDLLEQTDRYARLWTRKEAAAKGGRRPGLRRTRRPPCCNGIWWPCVEPASSHRHRVLPVHVPSGYSGRGRLVRRSAVPGGGEEVPALSRSVASHADGGGWLATTVGIRTSLWISTIGACCSALFPLGSPLRKLRELPATQPTPPTA